MGFQESISKCMGQYATFEGRASRSEFWWFYLFCLLIQSFSLIVFTVTSGQELGEIFSGIVSLIFVVPLLAVSARRMHDTIKVAGDIFGA